MSKNTLPKLIDTLRPNLPAVAKWAGVRVWTARAWQQAAYQPNPKERARLVKATRQHAKDLLALAQKVEREGTTNQGET
ncbi:MAG: hypothetical protein ACRENK_09330 [Gemmatimonadaceae bacterium]